MRYYITLIFTASFFYACRNSQNPIEEKALGIDTLQPVRSTTFSEFIPHAYELLDSATGDLDGDQISDIILVLKQKREDSLVSVSDTNVTRLALIFSALPSGGYSIAAESNKLIYSLHSTGARYDDPFTNIVVRNGYFTVEHAIGGGPLVGTRFTTFKYSKQHNTWILHKDGFETIDLNDVPDDTTLIENVKRTEVKTSKDFGIVTFSNFDIYKD